ncbi:MAG: ATP-grasp domain-containing protein [Bacteroidales bacterium]|nr:ATP-grasp domain-containing protein [Bacteroidales bacterium]
MNILFTCAGRRTYLLKYFKEQMGTSGLVVGADMQLSAPALTAADVKVQVPAVYAPNYIDTIIDICQKWEIKAIIPLNDLELPILARNREQFEKIGVIVMVAPTEFIDICFDKFKTAKFVESIGLSTPRTYINLHKAEEALMTGDLQFPLVLKPRWGSGSIGIEFVNNDTELRETYGSLLKKIKQTILSTASQGDEYILIQEKIEGQEYGMDVMNDLKGSHQAVSVKKKLSMRAGETDKAKTVENAEIERIGRILGENSGHLGNLDVDVFEKDGHYYVLELNPRFGGGFPFSYEAGVNLPKAILKWLNGEAIDSAILISRKNETFAKCDYLVNVGNNYICEK